MSKYLNYLIPAGVVTALMLFLAVGLAGFNVQEPDIENARVSVPMMSASAPEESMAAEEREQAAVENEESEIAQADAGAQDDAAPASVGEDMAVEEAEATEEEPTTETVAATESAEAEEATVEEAAAAEETTTEESTTADAAEEAPVEETETAASGAEPASEGEEDVASGEASAEDASSSGEAKTEDMAAGENATGTAEQSAETAPASEGEDMADTATDATDADAVEGTDETAASEEASDTGGETQMAMASAGGAGHVFGLGREALPEEIAAWDIDVRPDGQGLPDGSGDVATGEEIYIDYCASCHGDFGEAIGRWPVLAGGEGSLASDDPVKTTGSYWPYLSTIYDYVHRAMPFGNAQSLTDDEVYALTAYILFLNFLVEDDFTLSKENFAEIEMPNEGGFFMDDRPETELKTFSGEVCMENCKDEVQITMRARVLDVTPESEETGEAMDEAAATATEQPSTMVESAAEVGTEEAGDGSEVPAEMAEVEAESAEPASEGEDMAQAETTEPASEGEEMAQDETATTEESDATESSAEGESQVAALAADPELVDAGEKLFRQCQSCHKVGEGARNGAGPQLNGIVGRTVGAVDGFRYSNIFKEWHDEGKVWDAEALMAFLEDPKGYAKGTRMNFRGLNKEEDRQAMVAYLSTFE